MSYCRWSTPVPELNSVDTSFDKMLELMKTGGYDAWKKYCKDNKIIMSDVYVYESVYGGFMCHWKKSSKQKDVTFETGLEMADYLQSKKEEGFKIALFVIEELNK